MRLARQERLTRVQKEAGYAYVASLTSELGIGLANLWRLMAGVQFGAWPAPVRKTWPERHEWVADTG